MKRKTQVKYYFSVEGDTEKWYLDWLEKIINNDPNSVITVKLDSKIEKSPQRRVKRMSIITQTEIWHLCDYESNGHQHSTELKKVIDEMADIKNHGKKVTYKFGYSNLTFDLWIILHKAEMKAPQTHRSNYLQYINRAYNEHFESMDKYKQERNFKKCLSKLTLEDVRTEIKRSKQIMKQNEEVNVPKKHRKYEYYEENPSLAIWEIIEKILKDCELFQ